MDEAIEQWCKALESGEYEQTQWTSARDLSGTPVDPTSGSAVCFCAFGVARKLGLGIQAFGNDLMDSVIRWNDFEKLTFHEIAARIRAEYVK